MNTGWPTQFGDDALLLKNHYFGWPAMIGVINIRNEKSGLPGSSEPANNITRVSVVETAAVSAAARPRNSLIKRATTTASILTKLVHAAKPDRLWSIRDLRSRNAPELLRIRGKARE